MVPSIDMYQGKEYHPPLHLAVVAIEKRSPRITLDYGRLLLCKTKNSLTYS